MKEKKITCNRCLTIFTSLIHYKNHLKTDPRYNFFQYFSFCCSFYKFISYNETGLLYRLLSNKSYTYFHEQKEGSTGLILATSISSIIQNDNIPNISSYWVKRYYADGIAATFQINLKYDTT